MPLLEKTEYLICHSERVLPRKDDRENPVGLYMRYENQYFVYILTTAKNTALYTGVTNDLVRRVFEHKKM
jgi:hypothetical protein